MGAELFHEGGRQTDIKKLIVVFRNFAKRLKLYTYKYIARSSHMSIEHALVRLLTNPVSIINFNIILN